MLRALAVFVLSPFLSLLIGAAPVSPRQNLAILADDHTPMCGAVLLGPDVVLTAAHCVADDEAIVVRCGGEDIPAEIIKRDADEDLAALELLYECANASPSPLSDLATSNPEIGADVWAQGYPYGFAALSRGIVSAYEPVSLPPYDGQSHKPRIFLKTDLGIDPGNSGGGMFDARGDLVGLCSMSRGNFGFFVPVSRIRKFLTSNPASEQ